jgi:hypothetical protein
MNDGEDSEKEKGRRKELEPKSNRLRMEELERKTCTSIYFMR